MEAILKAPKQAQFLLSLRFVLFKGKGYMTSNRIAGINNEVTHIVQIALPYN